MSVAASEERQMRLPMHIWPACAVSMHLAIAIDNFSAHICWLKLTKLALNRVQADAESSNSPLVFGEWSLQTEFTADDTFLVQFADAQKMAYSQGAGWIVSSRKIGLTQVWYIFLL